MTRLPLNSQHTERGARLLRPTRPFTLHTSRQLMLMMGSSDETWLKYLFY